MPASEEMPDTIRRSSKKAQRHTKEELYERAKTLGVEGRSRMDKKELARAIARRQD